MIAEVFAKHLEEAREREKNLSDLLALGLEPMTSRLEKGGAAGWL